VSKDKKNIKLANDPEKGIDRVNFLGIIADV
jgi:hypothetical protein